MTGYRQIEESQVPLDGGAHRYMVLFPEGRAALDIGEQEGDRAARKVKLTRHNGPPIPEIIGGAFTVVNGLKSWTLLCGKAAPDTRQ
jgi:hypothetical protein